MRMFEQFLRIGNMFTFPLTGACDHRFHQHNFSKAKPLFFRHVAGILAQSLMEMTHTDVQHLFSPKSIVLPFDREEANATKSEY